MKRIDNPQSNNPRTIKRFIIFSVILFLIILVTGSVAFIFSMRQSIRKSQGNELYQMLEIERIKLETSVNAEIAIVLKLADSPLIKRFFSDPHNTELASVTFEEIASYRRAFTGNSIFWINDIDRMFYSDDNESYWVDAEKPENYWYPLTLYETDVYNFNINYNPDLETVRLWINAPVFDGEHNPIGMVGTSIDLSFFVEEIYHSLSDRVEFYHFNTYGEITGAVNPDIVIDKININEMFGDIDLDIYAIAGNLKNGETKTFDSVKGKVAVGMVPALDWYSVALWPNSISDYNTTMTALFLVVLVIIMLIFIVFNLFINENLKSLNETMESLKVASKAKSNFLATMSHEIRTPMNAILGIAEIHLQSDRIDSTMREALGKIHNSGSLLLSIINDILDMSKIEAGKLELSLAKYNVSSLINDTITLNMMRIGHKPISFELSVDENIPSSLNGDELRIKQILNNLLSNSFKYTKSGVVKLSVSAETIPAGTSVSGTEDGGVILVFRVTDTGQGMTEEQVAKLFDEYSRFNMEANRTTEGTGLGMSITRNLIRLMNGSIFVESEVGKGSVFTVHIPQDCVGSDVLGRALADNLEKFRLNSENQIKSAQVVFEPMPYGKVLVVDDVESNLYVAKGLMAPYKLSIETVMSGFDAIDRIKEGNVYDIVFMDHMMPKMDGIEATKNIRGLGYTHPIVALTANAVVGQSDIFLANGFDGFISKPIDIRELNTALRKLVRDKQPPEAIEAAHKQNQKEQAAVDAAQPSAKPTVDPKLAEIFARDAIKAAKTLEGIYEKRDSCTDGDIQLYVVNTHAMKSALANVGESDLSAVAAKLEQAGREKNTRLITDETPAFLAELQKVIQKLTPHKENGETVDENSEEIRSFLREKLLAIKEACGMFDKKTAKVAIAELRQKAWSGPTSDLLAAMAEHLLNGDFEEVSGAADKIIEGTTRKEN